jgi:small subunit ribosomal protein S6
MSVSRKYELVYIVSPEATDEQVAAVHDQIEQTVQRMDGTIETTDNWGRRKLAYEIGHHKEGVYVLEVITGSGELLKELERRLKVMDEVIRQLTVRVDEDERIIGRVVAEREEQRRQRRIARGLPPEEEDTKPEGTDASGDETREQAEV